MSEKVKEIMRESVNTDSLKKVQSVFNRFGLIQDESFFDYELLKDALKRKHISISHFLIKLGCRVRNPNKDDSEETALHLAMKLDNSPITLKMLKMGASIDDKNVNGETALFTAFAGGCKNSVKTALKFLSTVTRKQLQDFREYMLKRPDPTNADNILHFQIACVTDHCQAVNYYLEHNFDVNQSLILKSDKFVGLNPLQYAATKQLSSHLIQILLRNNGDISLKSSNGQTMLHILYYSDFSFDTKNIMELVFHEGNDTKFINSVDNNNVSHFHMFCSINYPEAVKVFINKEVDVNSPISSKCSMNPGYTPLHIAVKQSCEKVVKLLLENGANSRATSTDGTTPLHLACKLPFQERRFSIICMLMAHNANPAAVDTNNYTPLHLAFLHMSLREGVKAFDMLISKIPREVNYYDNDRLSHFHIVCIRNNVSLVNDFLQSGIDVNCCVKSKKYDGYTALHFAVLYNHKDVVEELLKWNAQVNVKTIQSQLTPLHLACNFNHRKFHEINIRDKDSANVNWISNRRNQLDIIKLLLLHGANVDDQDSSGKTPLLNTTTIDTVFYDSNSSEINTRIKEIIDILLVNKANINACTNNQESVLHLVTEKFYPKKSEKIVEHLLSRGADVHAVNDNGYTPLHSAVKLLHKELVQVLLRHGADVNAKSKDLLIPLQMIEETTAFCLSFCRYTSNLNDIICMLLENNSYVNVRNKSAKTLLQSAIESRNNFIIEKLLYYGADVNMEDSNGNSTVFSLSTWEIKSSTGDFILSDSYANADLFSTIFTHVQKLVVLGLYVSKQVQMLCSNLYERYYKDLLFERLSNVFDNCVKELDKMKSTKIDNYTSLYNILLKNAHEISKHVNNSTLIQILEDPNINNEFPLYSFLLKLQYKNGLKRSELSKLTILPYVINVNLPDLCYDCILKFLSNEDLINLQAAVKENCKRKLDSDGTEDEEPSLKIAKVIQKREPSLQ